jgi:hypothetical protein
MLGEMRRHSKSAIIYFLFAIIIIVFVFTFNTGAGMGGGGCSGTETPAYVEVDGQELTRDKMVMGMRMLPTLMSSSEGFGLLMGMGVDMMSLYSADPDRLGPDQAKAAMDTLVGLALVSREADRLGLEVSDRDLAKGLYPDQFFKKDENNPEAEAVFDWPSYNNWVSYWLLSSQTNYEAYVRSTLLARMAYNYVGGLVSVGDAEAKVAALAKLRKVNAEIAEFYPDSFDSAVVVPEDLSAFIEGKKEEIDAYYDANPAEFHTPEQIKLRVAYGSGLPAMPSPDDANSTPLKDGDYEKLLENANEMLQRLNGELPLFPEEKKPEAAEGEAAEAAPAAEAAEAKPAREEPKDKSSRFAELAKNWSADPATKDRGGLIPDWFAPEQLAGYPFGPEVAEAVAKAAKGEVVGPVRGVTGYWLVLVEDKRAPRDLSLEQARPEIAAKLYRKEKGPQIAGTKAKEFLDAAAKAGDKTLEALLDDYKELKDAGAIRVRKTGLFDAGKRGFSVPTVGSSEELFKELFTTAKVGSVASKVFELSEAGRIVIYRTLEVEAGTAEPSAEDLTKARDDLLRDKRAAAFQAWFAALKKTAVDNGDIEYTADWTDFLAALKTAQDQAAADKAKSAAR